LGEGFWEDFDGNFAAEFGIGGTPDFAHATWPSFEAMR
jgi:hypothetical protein